MQLTVAIGVAPTGSGYLYPDSAEIRKIPLRIPPWPTLLPVMIHRGFLDSESRRDLIDLARDGAAAHRLGRRANALLLLDDGMSCEAVGKVLFLDGDTIREWYKLYMEDGIEGLATFNHEGGSCRLTAEQQEKLKSWIGETLPRTTRQVGAWITNEFGIEYQTRSGLIALLHRLGMEHRRPTAISRKLDPAKQAAFIRSYESLMNQLPADEAVIFADAVHPTHTVRPVGCWAPKELSVAVEQSSGRQRLNVHGAIDLETGRTVVQDVLTVDAVSTIALLATLEARYPKMRQIHVFLDNARYHHAKLVQAWLARPDCRIKLHYVPAYCPHLNPIERLWGLMHRHLTHNTCYKSFREFSTAMLNFLRYEVPRNWDIFCDEVTDNFRVINPKEFRIIG
jgi:transposase